MRYISTRARYNHEKHGEYHGIFLARGRDRAGNQYLDPANVQVEEDYVLDKNDPHLPVSVPPGFSEVRSNRSWLLFRRCL